MKWTKIKDGDRSAIYEAKIKELNLTYEILPNAQRIDQKADGFILNRISEDYKFEDGIIGKFKGKIGICCGISLFCAIGLPPKTSAICAFDNLEELKELAELDFKNLKDGQDNVFVQELMKKPE